MSYLDHVMGLLFVLAVCCLLFAVGGAIADNWKALGGKRHGRK